MMSNGDCEVEAFIRRKGRGGVVDEENLHYLILYYDDFFFNYEGINRVNR